MQSVQLTGVASYALFTGIGISHCIKITRHMAHFMLDSNGMSTLPSQEKR
jgi:hypothetical protein